MRTLAALGLGLSLAASPFHSRVHAQELRAGTWRAWLEVGAGDRRAELPFGLEIDRREDGSLGAFLVNEPERIAVPEVTWDGKTLVLEMAHYDSRIRAVLREDGLLEGEWTKVRGAEEMARVPFRARPGFHDRFPISAGAQGEPASVDGRWAVDFSSDEPEGTGAVGVFEQEPGGNVVTGTFLTATGDYRYLAGSMDGRRLRLSCFDGAHAFLFDATLGDDGRLAGEFRSGSWWRETWTAERDPEASLGDAFEQTSWIERVSLADLVFPDLDGELRSLADPDLAGKAIVLQLFGSWCPNCHDETAYLVELDRRYRERGLSILGLAFELTGDFERDRAQLEVFAKRYGVGYPLFVAGTANKAEATQAFGAIDRLRSYPTTIFLHADGRVRSVHSGFAGPATGAEHAALRARFEGLIEELLAEAPPSDEATWGRLVAHPWTSTEDGATTAFREGEDGTRTAVLPGGAPLSVRLNGDAVWIGKRPWRFDRAADVLIDPLRFGARLFPEGGSLTPLLVRYGIESESAAIAALSHADPLVRREALVLLGNRRQSPPAGLPEAVDLFDDPSLEVRIAAAWAAGARHEPTAIEALVANLEHPNAGLRLASVRALIRMATQRPAILLKLAAAERDPVQLIREEVLEALETGQPAYDE